MSSAGQRGIVQASKITEPQQVSVGNSAGKLLSFVTHLLWRQPLRSWQIKADFERTQDSVSKTRAGSREARDDMERLVVSRSVYAASWDPTCC